jgi:hypothetical protein
VRRHQPTQHQPRYQQPCIHDLCSFCSGN